MKSRHTILPFLPVLLVLCSLCQTSCKHDEDARIVQCALTLKLSDASGHAIPDTLSGSIKAYMFVDGIYDRTVEPETGGTSYVSFDGSSHVTFVAIIHPTGDGVILHPPKEGTLIDSLWAELPVGGTRTVTGLSKSINTRAATTTNSPTLYYGSLNYASESLSEGSVSEVLSLYNKRNRVYVVVHHLLSQYGEGNYSIRLAGFRRGISYGGNTMGDSVVYTPQTRFTSSGDLVSDTLSTLPTATSDKVTVSLFRDGVNLASFTNDDSGKSITLDGGEDRCIVIDVSKENASSVTIVSWDESEGGTVFY